MSVSTEIDRLQTATDGIRDKMVGLGIAETTDNLTSLSQKIGVLEKPTGNKGQVVGFVENNEIGAVDLPSGGSEGLPSGGTTGQVLAKKSDTNGDVEWVDPASGSSDVDFVTLEEAQAWFN